MRRWAVLFYGLANYLFFHGVFLYSVLFLGNLWITKTLDGEPRMAWWWAFLINLFLLGLFSLQHSGMARPAFKAWLTRFLPEPMERSTYVMFSNLGMVLFFLFWEPIGGMVWKVETSPWVAAIYTLYFAGWGLLFVATCAVSHFDLFGVRQVWYYFVDEPRPSYQFKKTGMYRHVRHPIYVGWLVVLWATPTMSVSHLIFALGSTAYIVLGVTLEERDLVDHFGDEYKEYQRSVPALIPGVIGNSGDRQTSKFSQVE